MTAFEAELCNPEISDIIFDYEAKPCLLQADQEINLLEDDFWDFDEKGEEPLLPTNPMASIQNQNRDTTTELEQTISDTTNYEYSDNSIEDNDRHPTHYQQRHAIFDEELGDLNDISLNPADLPETGQHIIFWDPRSDSRKVAQITKMCKSVQNKNPG